MCKLGNVKLKRFWVSNLSNICYNLLRRRNVFTKLRKIWYFEVKVLETQILSQTESFETFVLRKAYAT